MAGDIKKYYLGTSMKNFVYAKLHRTAIPQKIIDAYKLEGLFDKKKLCT